LARRVCGALGLELGQLAVDLALAQLRLANGVGGGGHLVGDGLKGLAPLRERTGRTLTLVTQAGGGAFRKAFGEFAAGGGGGDLVVERAALVAQRLDAPLDRGIDRRPVGARRTRV